MLIARPSFNAGRRVLNVHVPEEGAKLKSALSLVVPPPCCFDPVHPTGAAVQSGHKSLFANRLEGQLRVAG